MAVAASLAAVRRSGDRARLDTSFPIVLDRAVDLGAVRSALRTEPALDGASWRARPTHVRLPPIRDLAPDTTYRIWVVGLEDADGVPFAVAPPSRSGRSRPRPS